jgi:hypothetical protein
MGNRPELSLRFSGQPLGKNGARLSHSCLVSKKMAVAREPLDIDWRGTATFVEYALQGKDRNYKFKDAKYGTLTNAQLTCLNQIQITISNKSQISL